MRSGVVTIAIILAAGTALGQVSSGETGARPVKLPAWDVVSVKRVDADNCTPGESGARLTHDGLNFECVPMLFVIEVAYQITEANRILDVPEWVKSSGLWEIDAKVAGDDTAAFGKLTRKERDQMVLALLADRFHLKAHTEQREMPAYDLVLAKGGPKLKEARAEENDEAKIAGNGNGRIEAVAMQIGALPWLLGNEVGRPVVDRTGLTGKYDFTVQYAPAMRAPADETGGPSIFTALEEQIGLKLEPAKERVDVLVIDSMEQPAAN